MQTYLQKVRKIKFYTLQKDEIYYWTYVMLFSFLKICQIYDRKKQLFTLVVVLTNFARIGTHLIDPAQLFVANF